MIITPEALKVLCLSTLTPLHEYDAIQIRKVKRSLIDGLMRVTCETRDHGHAFILEDEAPFQLRMGEPDAELPKAPERPDKGLATTNYKKFRWELTLYTNYMETERATVHLLKEVFPNSLVRLEVTYGQLPPNLKARTAFEHIEKMAKQPHVDHEATLTLQKSSYNVTHTPHHHGCTALFQKLESIQYQLKETLQEGSLDKLDLPNNTIIHLVIKAL